MASAPFKYVGGDPALDLVNTVDWADGGPVHERLESYDALTRWAEGAGVVTPAVAGRLRRQAVERPREAAAALEAARRLRGVLQRAVASAAGRSGGRRLGDDLLRELNEALAPALARLRLTRPPADGGGAAAAWGWEGWGEALDCPLWPVARSAAALLASDEAASLRVCAGADCGWVYVDRSRNGLRRWCEMETCGAREKARRHYARKRAG